MPFRSPNGFTLPSTLIAFMLFCIISYHFCQAINQSSKQFSNTRDTNLAEAYAAELLEFFRSLRSSQMSRYHSKNPLTGSTDNAKLYTLCSHINLLSSVGGPVLNPDPIGDLPELVLDLAPPGRKANRFYQIQVVNEVSLAVNTLSCGQRIKDYVLTPSERFLVSVGMSWADRNNPSAGLKRIILATLIPR